MIDEIARHGDPTREAYTEGMVAIADDMADRMNADPQTSRPKIFSVFASMVGALQLSRAIADPALSEAILDQATSDALTLLRSAARE